MANIHKILILRFSSLGDIVMATAMVRCLRKAYPDAQIDMVVREDFLDLIRHNPHLDQKIGLPRASGMKGLRSLLKDLNTEGYDLIYDAHRSLRTHFLMPLLKAPHKAYFEKPYLRRALLMTFKIPFLKNEKRMLERYIDPLAQFGVTYDGLGPEVVVPEEISQKAPDWVKPLKGRPLIAFVPSAQWPGKRWPTKYFRNTLEKIVQDTELGVVVLGGKSDDFCQTICKGMPEDRVFNAQGKFSILESSALLTHCQFVIANDTGMMHVADGLGIPSILMLGPTSQEMGCLPFQPNSVIMEKDLWCRPCSKNGQAPCIRKKRYCLEDLSPEMVFQSTKTLMKTLEAPA